MRRPQNLARKPKGRKRGKIFPDKSICKGFYPSMAVNSYLIDNVEGKQFYFSFGSFSTQRSLNLDMKSRFNFQACATPWFFLKLKL